MASRKKLVVLISGRGSNMAAIVDACRQNTINGTVEAVISNKASAAGLDYAKAAGIDAVVVDHKGYQSREAFDEALLDAVLKYQPDYVILAGFMRILTTVFVAPLLGKLVNIHPSLLPRYPGLNTHQRAVDAGDAEGGATVHFVTEELDGGPSIIQVRVPILPEDDGNSLADRVITYEHGLYVEAIRQLCEDRLRFNDNHIVTLDGKTLPPEGLPYQPGEQG